MMRKQTEETPERVARDQSNSASNGLKKTPKVLKMPQATS